MIEAPRKNGPFTVKSERTDYQNPWIRVQHHEVIRPDGSDGVYGVVRYANKAIGVLPLFEDGTVPLVGQHRFPFDAYSWELPEGGGPLDENPESAARRELLEETGLRADHLFAYGTSHLSNSVSDEVAHYFLAWGLTQGTAAPEPDEVLSHRRLPLSGLILECLNGAVNDALTILMVQTAVMKAQMNDLPETPRRLILGAWSQAQQERDR